MLYGKFLLTITALIFLFACNSSATDLDQLKTQIGELLEKQKGQFAVAFKDLESGDSIMINAHETFHAASTMKTPVMVELFRQAAEKKFSLSDSILIKNEFLSIADGTKYQLSPDDDSELELYKHIGEKRPINDLIYLMITKSSNLSTNLLIQLAGAEKVSETMTALGAGELKVLRGVEDDKAYQKGINNMVTADGLMVIFEKMAKGEIIGDTACQKMISILKDQQFKEIIPAQLPASIQVAHKTGWFKSVNHDSGIIFLPDGRKYVLVLLSKNVVKDEDAVKALANISGMIYQYMDQTRKIH
jgi:beta-lactamase class A